MTYDIHVFELIFWVMLGFVAGFVSYGLMGDRK